MNQKQYPEILLVRFTRKQRVWIRKESRRMKCSEAEVVRHHIDGYRIPDEIREELK